MKSSDAVHALSDRGSPMARGAVRAPLRSTLVLGVLLQGLALASSGCATVTTIQRADEHTVKVFSGTRQDLRAIGGETAENQRYRAPPPPYPWLDLPFSFALDVLVLPLTLPAAASLTWGR
ncbi:MAG: YceK/YidQ family lipoprotein [Burkholderiaceae bacterium]